MAAYAAVISLKNTIKGLLNSCSSSREILEFAYTEASSLQQVLEGLNNSSRSRSRMERVDAMEGPIRDCANKLEDFLESMNEEVQEDNITSFGETVKKMAKEYTEELSREDDDDYFVSSAMSDFGSVEMVGHSEEVTDIRKRLLRKTRPVDMCLYSFCGEEGSGRTRVANTVFEDVKQTFDCWAWVTVGPTKLKQVLISIVAQVVDEVDEDGDDLLNSTSMLELSNYLRKALENRRYLIVLGDVDDPELVDFLRTTSFPDEGNGSLVMITTASNDVAQLADTVYHCTLPARFFEESMCLVLRALFFGYESNIPPGMEEAGNKIVRNCCCSLIVAAKVFLLLLKSEKTVEEWSEIAADEGNPIFMVTDEVSEISRIKAEVQSRDMNDEATVEMISVMVSYSHEIERTKMAIRPERFFSKMEVVSVLGMAGIGKTTFARKIFNDEAIRSHFDHRVWITLGPNYQFEYILIDILAQIYPAIDELRIKGDEMLTGELCLQVSRMKCLIVLDDLCSKDPLFHLNILFPDIKGTTLVTTRLARVTKLGTMGDHVYNMELLDKKDSWYLLRQKVFAGESCPPELEKVGLTIAEKCDGLPLLILTVADQLLKVEMSEKYWNDIASGKEKSVFKNAHCQISEALLPSYHGLQQHLKPYFLYLGVFREKYEIPLSNLTNLWVSEGFLKPHSPSTEMLYVNMRLSELADVSLLIVESKVFGLEIKTCRLHSVFWHLSNIQAMKNKFFHAMNCYDDCSIESIRSQRRFSVRNSILLGMKDVQNSMTFNASARSLLCVSPPHQYPVPLIFHMSLLRVMNAMTIRLYEFPNEVVRLVHLRYLGLTCSGNLHASISSLSKLQYLIVKRYMNINSPRTSHPLPVEIWEMKELKHLQVMGGHLPNHRSGPGLLNLSTLLDSSPQNCREEVLKWIPNLKTLGIRIELKPNDEGTSFLYLNHIHHLHTLESLKCEVVNPHIKSEVFAAPAPISMFPASLIKLSLSGLGYPWEYMPIIGRLENLEVLKLKHYAFQGPKWEMDHTSPFTKLKFLLLQNTNLLQWKVKSVTEMELDRLSMKHCYRLQELPAAAPIGPITKIEIVDCSPLVVTWAEHLVAELRYSEPQISLSWIKQG